ncbi:hypothetical protein BUALT_Bualt05G0148200 [Buddleja alternifolia]|uniref:ZF-HD dimerization-type domain-containing protein n=1 Tax=Buddleja alternifolia TaxID=168488 RepID=A0AAV6XKT3_9LAMI|nr:hypothetical protein BUALT_Bualt05G0148200 [Buddleja alternifolia]
MDLESTPTKSADDTEIDTPPHTTQSIIKPLSFTNGAFKHYHLPPSQAAALVTYKECMKNHAATLGGHAVDGCGEFMPPPSPTDPTSLKCAACGCHRNFHRRDPAAAAITPPFLDFRHPNLPKRFSLSPSPPPPPAPPLPYTPNMLFTLSTAAVAEEHHQDPATPTAENPVGRKRFRTKFSQEQKEKMRSFSDKLGWRMQKSDEAAVREFCDEIGVEKGVLKVWMHNNKSKKEINGGCGGGDHDVAMNGGGGGRLISFENNCRESEERRIENDNNGSSSSL